MPPATTAPASGQAGKGMTIENGTGQTSHVHFGGPVSRTVVVPDGRSESVELAVGDYQVAAEVPGSSIRSRWRHKSIGHDPGSVDTSRRESISRRERALAERDPAPPVLALPPTGRVARPDDIARLALFFASEQSDHITGQAWNVDGGTVMH